MSGEGKDGERDSRERERGSSSGWERRGWRIRMSRWNGERSRMRIWSWRIVCHV